VDRVWPSGSRSTICGAEVCSCCMCTCVCVSAAQERLISTPVWSRPSLAVAAVAWQSGESGHYSTPPKMTSFPSFIITANPSIYLSTSPIANILHMYTGKIMLSFCPDMASSTDPSPMIIPYRTTLLKKISRCPHQLVHDNLTENSSTNPQTRSAHADATTEIVKPALPSKVLGVVGDHLYRPTLFPTTDAWVLVISLRCYK
jgi:hypothetical protein